METKQDTRAKNRPKRKPVGIRLPTQGEKREGFHRRWINEGASRIQKFVEGWYEKVTDSKGNPITRSSTSGAGRQILMEIPDELYKEDQEVKQKRYNSQIAEMMKPRAGKGFYLPGKNFANNSAEESDN